MENGATVMILPREERSIDSTEIISICVFTAHETVNTCLNLVLASLLTLCISVSKEFQIILLRYPSH